MKYYLVKVKKAFWNYVYNSQIVMRWDLAKGIYKDKIEILKDITEERKQDKTKKKYRNEAILKIEKEEEGEEEQTDETVEEEEGEEEPKNETDLDSLTDDELLQLANNVYDLKKPANTGRENLINSIKKAKKKKNK